MITAEVMDWVHRYEVAWRQDDVEHLDALFTEDVHYRTSPWAEPLVGLHAVRAMWSDPARFTMTAEPVAVEGPTAVVRTEVRYTGAEPRVYRNLWVLRFGLDGCVEHFEEWPYAPPEGGSGAAPGD